jgi:hypothetical protein
MTTDKRALDDLERNVLDMARLLNKHGQQLTIGTPEAIAAGPRDEEPAMIFMTIGLRGELNQEHAQAAAAALPKMRTTYPNAVIYMVVAGYDDDPREVHEIPEAREFFIAVANAARLYGSADVARAGLHEHMLGVLALCGALWDVAPSQVQITGREDA